MTATRGIGIVVVAVLSVPAQAAGEPDLSLPAGTLDTAVVSIGNRSGVTIGISDPTLADIRVRGISGRMPVAKALTRLLAGTPATFVQPDARTYSIVRRPTPPRQRTRPVKSAPAPGVGETIVVTGSKRSAPLADYAGSVSLLDTTAIRPDRVAHGSDALIEQVPVLSSTHLGPGRNKLFVRGIADSSFNGPTQATVGQYLGEVRLNYSAPDPDLALYDIASVEVLEGPQGTLYGAGSLGGVVRLVPTPPDLTHASLTLSAGGAITAHGAPGGDVAALGNLPIITDKLALRAVAYGSIDGGYIDDPLRGRTDINQTRQRGGRATLRYQPAPDWTIDLGGVVQNINSRDGQYTTRDLPPLERQSVIAQPFDNDYTLTSLVVRHSMGETSLVSATSAVWHEVNSTYDASASAATPMRYAEDENVHLLTNETRLSHRAATGGGWVLGLELLRSSDRLSRTLGPVGTETSISGTQNTVEQASLFGEATLRIAPRWFVTGGARIGFTHLVADVIDSGTDDDQDRHDLSVLPSAGILWKASPKLSFYVRYQEGFRPGGLSVQASGTQRYEADSVATSEAGMRYGTDRDRLTFSVAASYAHWEDIQADLVDSAGLPYTANIGSGRILGLEGQASWRPLPGLSIEGAFFVNDSNLTHPAPQFAGERDPTLPNIADLTAHVGARYTFTLASRAIEVTGSVHYVGRSRLGVGPLLDLHQGRYADTALGISAPFGRATISLDATNILDTRGNIFSLGNPFGVTQGLQKTPLRPRTIRLGVSFGF